MTSDERGNGLTHDEREAMDWLDTFKDRIPKASEWDGYKTRIGLVCDALRVLGADRLAASGGESPFTEAHGLALRELRVGEVLTAEAWEAVCAFIREGEAVLDARGERIRELEEASPPPAAEQGAVLVCRKCRQDLFTGQAGNLRCGRCNIDFPPAAALGEVTDAMVERACMALWPDEEKFTINPILRERNAPAIRKALLAALGRGEGS